MRIPATCLFLLFSAGICAQETLPPGKSSLSREDLQRIIKQQAAQRPSAMNLKSRGNLPVLRDLIKGKEGTLSVLPSIHSGNIHGLSKPGCTDSSFVRLNGIVNNSHYVSSITHTRDNGVLMAGYATNINAVEFGWQYYGTLTKTDSMGNTLWTKIFADPLNRTLYGIFLTNVAELANGDILIIADVDTAQGNTSADALHHHTLIARLSATGATIWYKTYNSSLAVDDDYMPIDVRSINEGPNGDLILCGTTFDQYLNTEVIIRLDNAGNKIWDNNFQFQDGYSLGTEGLNAFYENGALTVVGISHGDDLGSFEIATHFLTLDYTTGQLLTKRFFHPNYTANPTLSLSKSFTDYFNHCVKLNNGHYLVYGQLFDYYLVNTAPFDQFGVIEFDAGHNLVSAYTITDNLTAEDYTSELYFDPSGNGLFRYLTGPYTGPNVFIGSIRAGQIVKERMVSYTSGGIGQYGSFGPNQLFCYFNDGGYLLDNSYYKNNLLDSSYNEFRKMHDSDTPSVCLGIDSITEYFNPYDIIEDPGYPYFGDPYPNQVNLTSVGISILDTFSYTQINPCRQQSYCDTIKIHGDTVFCTSLQPQLFSVYKDPLCGSFPLWTIDSTVVDSSYVVSDTTIAIRFKNINWQGKLSSSLYTGKCNLPIEDSITLHVINTPLAISLGPDTVLCGGNSITLHAGVNFSTYLWQDGSTDSILVATLPGKYDVLATDFCKNTYTDTILITTANFPFTIGN
ncbi:MAG TPA: hypothetical protein VKR53_07445, partial [Puia sp.]|nr:hypothetical protein [Puia sp.]